VFASVELDAAPIRRVRDRGTLRNARVVHGKPSKNTGKRHVTRTRSSPRSTVCSYRGSRVYTRVSCCRARRRRIRNDRRRRRARRRTPQGTESSWKTGIRANARGRRSLRSVRSYAAETPTTLRVYDIDDNTGGTTRQGTFMSGGLLCTYRKSLRSVFPVDVRARTDANANSVLRPAGSRLLRDRRCSITRADDDDARSRNRSSV